MGIDELLKLYPEAGETPQTEENIKSNEITYALENLKTATVVFCFFLDKFLYSVMVVYNSDFVSKVGGEVNLYKKLVGRLGKDAKITTIENNNNAETKSSSQIIRKAEWIYPAQIDRSVGMLVSADGTIVVNYKILSKDQVIRDRLLKQSDVGF